MSSIANFNALRAWDGNGVPLSGAQAWFYDSGTDQRRAVYADTGATVEHAQPVTSDSHGIFAAVYVAGGDPVRVEMRDADGVMLPGYPLDPVLLASVDGASASGVAFHPTDEIPALNVQQAIEMVREGAIQPVLDLGLGVTGNGPLLEDLNATGTASGIYRVTSATVGTWPSGVTAGDGIVLLERHSALRATETLKMIAGGIYVRRLSTTWGAWAQLLDASTHSQATWNAGSDASPRAISPSVLTSWRNTWATAWGHALSVWNTGTNTELRAISPKILTDWLKAKIGTPGSTGLALLAATSVSAARNVLVLGGLAAKSAVNNADWSGTDLSVLNGGTGASTPSGARANLELGTVATENVVPVSKGGTGGTNPAAARIALNIGAVGVEDVVPISKGGTGGTTQSTARNGLGLGTVATEDVVPVSKGGTGSSNQTGARNGLGLGTVATEDVVPVSKGGTGATSTANARSTLGAPMAPSSAGARYGQANSGTPIDLPSGGTWEWCAFPVRDSTGSVSGPMIGGTAAGGTRVQDGVGGTVWLYRMWRIA